MASIARDKKGNRRILFFAPDGRRMTVRLGKVSQRDAEPVKLRIEHLLAGKLTGNPITTDTARWVAELDERLADKLARVGLLALRVVPAEAMVVAFIQKYILERTDLKQGTRTNLEITARELTEYFGQQKLLRDVTPGDADRWRVRLLTKGLAENTVRRMCGRAKQFFNAAKRQRLIEENPFADLKSAVQGNPAKFRFVTRDETQRLIEACPDVQWQMIVALARYGGLRTPSETFALRWGDIDWAQQKIRVPSPKTEHLAGRAERWIPLFPELRPILAAAFDAAAPFTEFVITRYRNRDANPRTQFERIIRKAGLTPWPKPFQNLRSTRETELAETFPVHVVCGWIGNSQSVATRHYLQLTEDHFRRAVEGGAESGAQMAQNAAQQACAGDRTESQCSKATPLSNDTYAITCESSQLAASEASYPARIRTLNEGAKIPSVTITPPGSGSARFWRARAAQAADDGERELFQLDRQVHPHQADVVRQREGHGSEVEDSLDADRHQSVRHSLGGRGRDGDHGQPYPMSLGNF